MKYIVEIARKEKITIEMGKGYWHPTEKRWAVFTHIRNQKDKYDYDRFYVFISKTLTNANEPLKGELDLTTTYKFRSLQEAFDFLVFTGGWNFNEYIAKTRSAKIKKYRKLLNNMELLENMMK